MKKNILAALLLPCLVACRTSPENTTVIDGNGNLEVQLSAKDEINLGDEVSVAFTVKNNTDTVSKFIKWQTPLEERITGPIFKITFENEELPYQGIMVKRAEPTAADSVTLAPGESATNSVALTPSYAFDKAGTYEIKFLGRLVSGLPDSAPIQLTIK